MKRVIVGLKVLNASLWTLLLIAGVGLAYSIFAN
jgi:hypothetical protein